MSLTKAEEEATELILQAIHYNNIDLLRELLLENPGLVNFRDSLGRTGLHYASIRGNAECALALLELGADIDAISTLSDDLKSPLLLASQKGHVHIVKLLVENGVDLFHCDSNGYSALQLAQLNGHESTASLLISSIGRIHDEAAQLRTKLCAAIIDGDHAIATEVLNAAPACARKQILNGERSDEKSALYLACEHGRSEIIQSLLRLSHHSIIYNPTGDTVLHASVSSQDSETVQIIINKFPFLMEVTNNDNSLPLHWSCRCGNIDVVRVLLEHNYPKNEVKAVENGRGADSFYKFPCDLNATDNECRTPLYLAAANGHAIVVQYLTEFKLRIFQPGEDSSSECSSDSFQTTPFVQECPFILDVYSTSSGRTPLMIACASGNIDVVRILLDHGADVNLPVALTDVEISNLMPMEEARCIGSGALVEAAKNCHPDLVRLLLNHGAQDFDNKALVVTITNGNLELVPSFLCQLTFPDTEYRIHKNSVRPTMSLSSAAGSLLNTNLLANVQPTTSCQLNWHNASLDRLHVDWLVSAAMHLNPRVKQSRIALTAITRVDLSNNHLTIVPYMLFHLQSMRILNLDQNCITRIEFPPSGEFQASCLENFSIAGNCLPELPVQLFSERHFPQLKVANFSSNCIRYLSPAVWSAPRLRELNLMNNEITYINSRVTAEERRHVMNGIRRHGRHPRKQMTESDDRSAIITPSSENVRARTEKGSYSEADSRSRWKNISSPKLQSKEWVSTVTNMDIIRVNIWQKKIHLSNIEDCDDEEEFVSQNQPINSLKPGQNESGDGQNNANMSDSFSNSLRILNLSGNKLKQVPSCLACCCPRLTKLDVSINEISCIGPVECLPSSLRHLNLSHNQLVRCFTSHIQPMDPLLLACQSPIVEDLSANNSHHRRPVNNNSYSVSRHSRSRSKSVARNQRSLSVIRASEEQRQGNSNEGGIEPCAHRSHCRFEALKTLNLSHNSLQTVDLLVAFGGSVNLERFNWKENGQQMKSYVMFPALTNLDLSHNKLRSIPGTISLLSYLSVLNVTANSELDLLPPELGLLDKLWNVGLRECPLRKEEEPLRSMVNDKRESYKTIEILMYLRNKLENSKLYPKLKLMIIGGPEVGKTTLLQQMRQEGNMMKKSLQSESWAQRLGHSPIKAVSTGSKTTGSHAANYQLLSAIRKGFPVDVSEWSFEPKKSSKSGPAANIQDPPLGPVTFRAWDFSGLQKEFAIIQQYFFTRRCLYLVVWKVTEGEIALNEIHNWLLAIQTRAPNSTVLIVGTHADYVKDNHDQRFPREYLEELDASIQERFVNVSDADKRGLPRVIASLYVSSKSREDIRSLCSLLYQVAGEMRSIGSGTGRKSKLLAQKVPASFVALEKISVSVTDELRMKGEEPILRFDDFWVLATTQMIEEYGKPFRDILEFRQACNFLHENGIIVHFDDTALRDFVFIDPPWLCALLRAAVAGSSTKSTSLATMYQQSFVDRHSLYSSLKFALRQFGAMSQLVLAARGQSQGGSAAEKVKFRLFRACLLNLLSKFELALPCLNKMVVLPSLLPDEYLLRADYPGAKVRIRTKIDKWQLRHCPSMNNSLTVDASNAIPSSTGAMVSPIRQYLAHRRLVRTLAYSNSIDEEPNRQKAVPQSPLTHGDSRLSIRRKSSAVNSSHSIPPPKVSVEHTQENILRRLYVMQYIPPGFWPRLTTRLLDDEKLCATLTKLFVVTAYSPVVQIDSDDNHEQPMDNATILITPNLSGLTQAINIYGNVTQNRAGDSKTYKNQPEETETSFILNASGNRKNGPPSPNRCCDQDDSQDILSGNDATGLDRPPGPSNPYNDQGGFEWLLWQTGIEISAFGTYLFSLKQLLPLANVRDVNYSTLELEKRWEDGVWRSLALDNNVFLLEIIIPALSLNVEWNGFLYHLEMDRTICTKFLSIVTNMIDDLLEDWFPALGTRFVHSSEGKLLVDRLIPCYHCARQFIQADNSDKKNGKQLLPNSMSLTKIGNNGTETSQNKTDKTNTIYMFSVEECILEARHTFSMTGSLSASTTVTKVWPPEAKLVKNKKCQDTDETRSLICPKHSENPLLLELMAPDVVFADLVSTDFVVSPENIRRGKLVGRGAFGFVFNGFTKQKNEILTEVALKVLEPIDPGQLSTSTNVIGSARAAFEAFASRWKNDALESCARSYSTARQELNMLAEIRHPHVTSLLGFSIRPMTLIVELAPHGALDTMLSKYRRSNARLQLNTIQHTCVQIAKALEYLHVINHIIYRDLKSENVLIWRYPPPHTSNNQTTMTALDVHVKLGDYGISRYSYPSGVCKGYGGTEGFMAPEIMRYNGEQEYTEKVDCFSFGMFIYELISLKQPYEGHDQMKDFILEGRRPYVSEKELLLPSNLLDLMVICWSENAEFRPSSSQLVGICSAPEFTHLLDVALLKDNEIAKVAAMITQTQRDDESIDSDQITQSCWMLRSSNQSNCSISSLTCSQFGWTDKKIIETTKPVNSRTKAVITAMCQVEETVWMGDSDGNITICLCSNLIEISSFSAENLPSADRIPLDSNRRSPRRTRTPPSPAKSSSVRSILYFEERQMIVVALRHTLLMCRQSLGSSGYSPREDDKMPEFLASIELNSRDEIFHAALIPSLADWQIWTAHANATIFVHHISANTDRLVFSTSVNHTTLQSRAEPSENQAVDFKPEKNVKLLVSSRHTANVVWSALEDDSRIFMWRNSSLRKTLDCCKILPISESLSSMNIEVARESKVTCMALIGNNVASSIQTSREQLLVGTNRGVIVVVQAIEMLPLTSFRPYNSEIEQILVCGPAGRHKHSGIIFNELRQSSKPTQQMGTSNSSYSIRNPENAQSMDAKDTVCQNEKTSARQPSSGRKIAKIKQQLYQRGRANSTDATGPLLDSLSSKGSVFYETVTKGVKDILNTGLPGSSSAYSLGSSSTGNSIDESYSSGYFITIGKEYRCLLNRFTTVSDVADGFGAESSNSSSDRCAIFWRSDEWIK